MLGGRELFWAMGSFEKVVTETRWVAMKERKMNIPENFWLYIA